MGPPDQDPSASSTAAGDEASTAGESGRSPETPALASEGGTDEQGAGEPRQLHPLPPGLVELYGLLAVLFVLVPEWMASGALFGFREGRRGSELPAPSGAWKRLPELRLAGLNLAELRLLAQERRLAGYSRQNRQQLTERLLRQFRARA